MTSRNLCFKLMREDLKRRLWTVAWSIVSMVFSLIVPIAVNCSNFTRKQADMSISQQFTQIRRIVESLWFNIPVIVMLMITAVLWAVSGYQYLHNRQKVDFYHSIPVKRHQLFLAAYLNGILVPLVCYGLAQAAAIGFLLSAGIGFDRIGSLPWQSLLINSVYYCLIYTTVIIAMMMTGHVVVALLGAGVFFGYGPAVVVLGEVFCETNFRTWIYGLGITDTADRLFMRLLRYTSPFSNYILALNDFADNEWSLWRALPVALVTAALALVAYGLYRLRASEAAGRAMAFDKTKAVIRILIAIPVGIAGGMFFGSFAEGVGWLAFGTVCGVLLTHCLMEIIYHFDFRKLFADRYQLVLCAVIAIVVNIGGYYDLFGYDSWYPKADEIVDAAVYDPSAANWVSYGNVVFEKAGIYSDYVEEAIRDTGREYDGHYAWSYGSSNDYRMTHMKLTDAYTVSELARRAAEQEKLKRFDQSYDRRYRSVYLRVKLKNGRQVYRHYNCVENTGESEKLYNSIVESQEYKQAVYPIMNQTAEETAAVYFMQNGSDSGSETAGEFDGTGGSAQDDSGSGTAVRLDAAGREELLAAFKQDMLDQTTDAMEHELPIGTIQFRTRDHEEAVRYNNALQEAAPDIGYDIGGLVGRNVYPVYPSFARTLKLLEETGVEIRTLADEDIIGIDIYYYGERYRQMAEPVYTEAAYAEIADTADTVKAEVTDAADGEAADAESEADAEDTGAGEGEAAETLPDQKVPAAKETSLDYDGEVKYEDPEDIRALAPGLVYSEYVWMNSDHYDRGNLADGVNVTVRLRRNGTRKSAAGEYKGQWTEELDCEIDLTKLSEETRQKYGLWN